MNLLEFSLIRIACVANIFARVRQQSWNESEKRGIILQVVFALATTFAITQLGNACYAGYTSDGRVVVLLRI